MTQIRGSLSLFAHGRRALTAAALAALVLTGCGSVQSGGGQRGDSAAAVSETRAPRSSAEHAASATLFEAFGRACPPPGTPARRPAGGQAVAEGPESVAPGETPPTRPIEPAPPTGPEAELNAREWCMSGHHEQRIVAALQKLAEPTPATVRATLNRLGYTDDLIHALQQDGTTTRLHLDLRESGGRLCESVLAAGAVSDIAPCVAAAEGPFEVTSESRP
ncbi:hypothetical protein [Streptomyces sp. V2I9]|uniref:hypothetical protein n=1 Tax=Streptomyces sp. V2I9 TaxID=3042304 RepID=UPI00277F2EA6|nr:hypothetical protein [Streptomyces sp. V2I9]MDQ0984631.1 hypothetical protein [Streptomyces sp. V2I9]